MDQTKVNVFLKKKFTKEKLHKFLQNDVYFTKHIAHPQATFILLFDVHKLYKLMFLYSYVFKDKHKV